MDTCADICKGGKCEPVEKIVKCSRADACENRSCEHRTNHKHWKDCDVDSCFTDTGYVGAKCQPVNNQDSTISDDGCCKIISDKERESELYKREKELEQDEKELSEQLEKLEKRIKEEQEIIASKIKEFEAKEQELNKREEELNKREAKISEQEWQKSEANNLLI